MKMYPWSGKAMMSVVLTPMSDCDASTYQAPVMASCLSPATVASGLAPKPYRTAPPPVVSRSYVQGG